MQIEFGPRTTPLVTAVRAARRGAVGVTFGDFELHSCALYRGSVVLIRSNAVTLNTIALELVPPNVERGPEYAVEEARKVARISAESGLDGRIKHVMIPGMIAEDDDRPVPMKPKLDVLEYWSLIQPELPGLRGLCTQVTAVHGRGGPRRAADHPRRRRVRGHRLRRRAPHHERRRRAPVSPRRMRCRSTTTVVDNRGVILIPTREGEQGRFDFKCNQGANFGMTQLLYSDAIVGFLTDFAKNTDHRPEILLSFGFVPKVETRVGLIDWLIQDPGNAAVADEQEFVRSLASRDPADKRQLMVDLYKRVIDGVADLGFPLSIHFEATYGVSGAAFETFAEMLAYWSPDR